MPASIRRLFGFADDATAGGSEYDDLVAGAIPDASIFWPVTGGNLDWNIERTERNDEVRGRRAATAPVVFRAAPVMTVPVPAYLSVVKKGLRKTLGAADTVTGIPVGTPTHYNHSLGVLGPGSVQLPAVHAQMVRDDLNHKMSGSAFQRGSFTFPLDGEGTCEFELWGLYAAHFGTAPPTVSFTGLSDEPLMLRDAQVFIDGAAQAIPDLQGFEFSFTNNLQRKPYAKRNIVTQTIGTPAKTRKLWFPAENKVGSAQDVTYAINLGNTNTTQELAHQYGQIQKFVFECSGAPIPSTAVNEMLRVTIYAGEHTGGGAEALSARDDITSRFEGSAFYSEADGADILVEVLDGVATPTT